MAQLSLVLVYHGPLLFAIFWEWLAIYFYQGVSRAFYQGTFTTVDGSQIPNTHRLDVQKPSWIMG